MEVTRKPNKKQSIEVDLTKPIPQPLIIEAMKGSNCFGKLWDISTKECSQCADKDICGIMMQDTLAESSKQLQKKLGATFLDVADYKNVTNAKLMKFVVSGETTTKQLIQEVVKLSNCDDTTAAVEHIKRWIKGTKSIFTKTGIVWKR